ncbi:choline dehydrogenase [Pelagibius litoralis]|uniref:Choline dehydrogenase n=1 Tax=Pelagibius litoralis TaxID=374515 RepID=A0A967C4W7_9PROT|nr:choline dehydrogenase [Pelagibius litoralis]NIA68905.1 choline dehydrogenase [Pelagibius litoralis]
MAASESFDYIIVGAGSAGCVLASRLSEDPDVRVLVLEAGGRDNSIFIHMPAALAKPLANDKYNWFYHSEPEPHVNNRQLYCPRGRVLGGSSSINGMAYVRGHARDYDRWGQSGLSGWSYADVLPYFRKAETYERGPDDYRGGDGPLQVSAGACTNPLFQAWIEAGRQAGYPVTSDMNGRQQEGFAHMDMTVHNGRRWSAMVAYLKPAMTRPDLTVWTRALTTRLLIENNRAVGVELAKGNERIEVRAEREVILSGGAINSPQVLLLSGIGPADELTAQGIPVVQDLPGVGKNLQDHLEVYVQHACTQPITLYSALKPWNQAKIGFDWLFFKKGLGATSHFEAGGFIRSRAGVEHPDLQYHFLPIAMNYDGSSPAGSHGFQAHVGPMRSQSRGEVTLKSSDPKAPPRILFNYLSQEADRQEFRAGIRLTREVFAQKAFDEFRGPELAPGPAAQSDEELDAFVREHVESAYHPSCSCRMGTDSMAVVDGAAKVHGLEALRVVDASIMPSIVSGNLNAPTIMLAEKLADTIRGKTPLPSSDAPVWIAPNWDTAQR